MKRIASIHRKTKETEISVMINLEGKGISNIDTGIGFFNHMLEQFSYHSLIDINIEVKGDLHVDDHHTVEDCGILLGCALDKALGERKGIVRYASLDLVMDESCTKASVDISGRSFLKWKVNFSSYSVGSFDLDLVREFFQAFTQNSKITLHIINKYGKNNHHISETCFKAAGRVLCEAVSIDPRKKNIIPSTKGSLKEKFL